MLNGFLKSISCTLCVLGNLLASAQVKEKQRAKDRIAVATSAKSSIKRKTTSNIQLI